MADEAGAVVEGGAGADASVELEGADLEALFNQASDHVMKGDEGGAATAAPAAATPAAGSEAVVDGGAAPVKEPAAVSSPGAAKPAASDPAPTAAEQAAMDALWATATPEQKAAFEAAQNRANELEGKYTGTKARYSALQRQMATPKEVRQNTTAAPAPAAPSGAAAPGAAKPAAATTGYLESDAFKTLEKDYPEVAAPVRAGFDALNEQTRLNTAQLADLSTERRQQYIEGQNAAVVEAHPDAGVIVNDKNSGWNTWVAGQPRYIQEAIARNGKGVVDAIEAIDIFDRFKSQTNYAPKPAPQPGTSAAAVPTNPQAAARQLRQRSAIAVPAVGGQAQGSAANTEDAIFDEAVKKMGYA